MADRLKLYVVPASHPCAAVERALELKGLAYDRVDLLPLFHVAHQRVRFGQRTVPALRCADGAGRLSGSRPILRYLEALEPEPPLLPADPVLRAKVEGAEEWGDVVLQPLGRRIPWCALQRRQDAMPSYTEGYDLKVPIGVAMRASGLVTRALRAINHASDDAARADLAALPGYLDRIESYIDHGVLGGPSLNVADLQIASTLRLLTTLDDVAPIIDGRPAGALARRAFPTYPGSVPAGTLPAAWLPTA